MDTKHTMKDHCRHKVNHGYVKVSVTDMGIGIATEYLESIFERFKEVEQSPKAKKQGPAWVFPFVKRLFYRST